MANIAMKSRTMISMVLMTMMIMTVVMDDDDGDDNNCYYDGCHDAAAEDADVIEDTGEATGEYSFEASSAVTSSVAARCLLNTLVVLGPLKLVLLVLL